MGGVWGHNVDSSTTPGQKFLPFLVSPRSVKKSLGDPFHPLESSSQVESWCPGNKFRFLNLKPGGSASARCMEKNNHFEHSWRPWRNRASAALSPNGKTHLGQRSAIPVKVFIQLRPIKRDPSPERPPPPSIQTAKHIWPSVGQFWSKCSFNFAFSKGILCQSVPNLSI